MDNEVCENQPNRVAGDNGFKNKTILLTGAVGFLGKVLLEKILRTCPLVKKIYVLVRGKNGKSPQDRINEIFKNCVFDTLKNLHGEEMFTKVVAISGDIAELDLGLSVTDYKIITEEVQIIYHLAATTSFTEPFKKAVLVNTRGTKLMIGLGKKCKNLLVFTHASTTFCHPEIPILYETTYPPPADPKLIIEICEKLDDNIVEDIGKIPGIDCLNTYAYSKALAEDVIAKEMNNLPIIIVRPSIVLPIWKDPLPGWTDGLGVLFSMVVAMGKGVLQSMNLKKGLHANIIPADVVANALMWTTYCYLNNRKQQVYNICAESPYTFKELAQRSTDMFCTSMPLNNAVWYPQNPIESNIILHKIKVILFQYVPAVIFDGVYVALGRKPILWKIQKKLTKHLEIIMLYLNRKWKFDTEVLKGESKLMNQTEIELYNTSMEKINIDEFIADALHGARLYVFNEGDETIPKAKMHIKMMWVIDKIYRFILVLILAVVLLKCLSFWFD